ncbi:MAG TPA: trehalase-like domain-containing protein, partial [Acetobacteraceae bacterium]|nr:trehalase-like domain-containing protein [Acetobacteraceae bacterium]
WLCWPRFDSPACFAALLGGPEHGRWLIAPLSNVVEASRGYRDDTLMLETRFVDHGGQQSAAGRKLAALPDIAYSDGARAGPGRVRRSRVHRPLKGGCHG